MVRGVGRQVGGAVSVAHHRRWQRGGVSSRRQHHRPARRQPNPVTLKGETAGERMGPFRAVRGAPVEGLGSNLTECPRRHLFKGRKNGRDSTPEIFHAIALGSHNQNGDWQGILVLLMLHALVGCEQHVKVIPGEVEQLSVLDTGPTLSLNRALRMTYEEPSELLRHGFVKQDAHLRQARLLRLREPAPRGLG